MLFFYIVSEKIICEELFRLSFYIEVALVYILAFCVYKIERLGYWNIFIFLVVNILFFSRVGYKYLLFFKPIFNFCFWFANFILFELVKNRFFFFWVWLWKGNELYFLILILLLKVSLKTILIHVFWWIILFCFVFYLDIVNEKQEIKK